MRPSVIILSFNSIDSLAQTLASVAGLSDDVHVVDSGSTDGTLELASAAGAHVVHHPFENYGAQRNWAIDTLHLRYRWQLHLDADESISAELLREITELPEESGISGYFIGRLLRFLCRTLRHGGMSPTWHMRLFRTGAGRCESREYDQHFFCTGAVAKLSHTMVDDVRMSLSEWTARHNRWADAEVREIVAVSVHEAGKGRIQGKLTGNIVERKRFLRSIYDNMPLFMRPFLLFFYRYFFRLGFLDGIEGMIFWVLQTFWFRFLVDAKLYEYRQKTHLKHK